MITADFSGAPFPVDLVIRRVQQLVDGAGKPLLQQVRGVADYAAIDKFSDFRPPESFVVLARERGKETTAGSTQQFVEAYFGVVTAVRNYRDQRGKPALDDVSPIIGRIRQQLIGWVPQTAEGVQLKGGRPCIWVQGDVMDYDASTLLWSDVFKTQHLIGSQRQ